MKKSTKTTSITRPETILFLNISVDGRITSHDSDAFDPDQTWKQTPGIRGILQQFYEFKTAGLTALTTGGSMASLGVNHRTGTPKKEPISLVVLDPDADLTLQGINYLSQNVTRLMLICLDSHPIVKIDPGSKGVIDPGSIVHYPKEIDLNDAFKKLYQKHQVKKLFIHSIAPLNADLIDAGLIDHLSIIVSPLLVGGHGTPALQDSDILTIRTLKLTGCHQLAKDYLNLRYDVVL